MPEQEQQTTPETPGTQQDPVTPEEPVEPEPTQAEPVSLAEAKQQLRVEFSEDDALIQGYITAAREICEGFLNQPLVAAEGEEPPVVKQAWKQAILDAQSAKGGRVFVEPGGVDEKDGTERRQLHGFLDRIRGGSGGVGDDDNVLPGKRIEQGGFSCVASAEEPDLEAQPLRCILDHFLSD